ncbi:unnamed protein product [Lathyrus sativus]|nr:unnamed protein product [Lathyrus sativus]
MMPHVLATVVDGVSHFVKTLWGLQERRCSYTFDAVTSAAVSVTMTFVLCFFSVHNRIQRRGGSVFFSSF